VGRVGHVSYGIYLYHLLVFWPASKLLARLGTHSQYALFAAVTLLTWALAELSYRCFEQRFLALKEHFSPDRGAAGARVTPVHT
jgi:peptidoglycan/LPS O-acetylase OafA/YrhL